MTANQTPTFRRSEPYAQTEGDLAIELARAYGIPPHEWQELILRDWLAVDEAGRLVNTLCLLPVPRQNGKTGVSDPRETYGLVVRGEHILHTAQEFQTAKKAFDRLREKFGDYKGDPFATYPELNALVEKYTTSANQMVLDLTNGAHIEFRTRGSNADMGRGGTFDLVVIDEGQTYTEEQDAALSPLNSAAPGGSPQTIIMGTVPSPKSPHKGQKFTNLRSMAREGAVEGICIHEWSVPEVGDVTDESRWYEVNPSLGKQLLLSGLRKDLVSMSPTTFAMEHLGWWPDTAGTESSVISSEEWQACARPDAPTDEPTAFGVKFSPDGSEAAIAVAIRTSEHVHVELVDRRSISHGTKWLVDAVLSYPDTPWVIDGRSGAQALIERLGDEVEEEILITPSAADATAAATSLLIGVRERSITWFKPAGAPEEDQLTLSVQSSPRRKIGNQGGWGFGGTDSAPVEAAALAAWHARKVPEQDDGEMEVYF